MRPGDGEICDGLDDDCDGLVDELGAHCTAAQRQSLRPVRHSANGRAIIHVEKYVGAVDLTGVNIWQDTIAGTSYPAGIEQEVQSILVRNWMGTSSFQVYGQIDLYFPPEVTVLGWIADFQQGGPINRALDPVFSTVPGGLGISATPNTQFENNDWATATSSSASFSTFISTAADEARLLISYDPAVLTLI